MTSPSNSILSFTRFSLSAAKSNQPSLWIDSDRHLASDLEIGVERVEAHGRCRFFITHHHTFAGVFPIAGSRAFRPILKCHGRLLSGDTVQMGVDISIGVSLYVELIVCESVNEFFLPSRSLKCRRIEQFRVTREIDCLDAPADVSQDARCIADFDTGA